MVHEISRREVLNNLIRFKDSLLDLYSQGGNRPKFGAERKYKVLLNCHTGDMRFAQKLGNLESHIGRTNARKESASDWKEAYLVVQQKSMGETAQFFLRNASDKELKSSDLDPIAFRIVNETAEILNAKAREVKTVPAETLIEEALLQDLSTIHLAAQGERIEDLPGWMGSINRVEAEHRLEGKPVGTYLLREGDEITKAMAFHFSEENVVSVHPYVITLVEQEGKISEYLLLKTDKGWTLYHDDPDLKDTTYHFAPSPRTVLHELHHLARHPIL